MKWLKAGTDVKIEERSATRLSSIEVPSQTFDQPSFQSSGSILAMFSGLFVKSNQSSQGVAAINAQRSGRHSLGPGASSNTSANEQQKTRCGIRFASASRFHLTGPRQ